MATNPVFWITLYLICWAICLFCILPIGVRSLHEMGEAALGHDSGAPVRPMLRKKIIWTSVLALAVWAFVMLFVIYDPLRIRS